MPGLVAGCFATAARRNPNLIEGLKSLGAELAEKALRILRR